MPRKGYNNAMETRPIGFRSSANQPRRRIVTSSDLLEGRESETSAALVRPAAPTFVSVSIERRGALIVETVEVRRG